LEEGKGIKIIQPIAGIVAELRSGEKNISPPSKTFNVAAGFMWEQGHNLASHVGFAAKVTKSRHEGKESHRGKSNTGGRGPSRHGVHPSDMSKDEAKKFKVRILWGSKSHRKDNLEPASKYAFATQGELDAFLLGVDESNGWHDYEVVQTQKEADAELGAALKKLRAGAGPKY
jgi:hypothetical protein